MVKKCHMFHRILSAGSSLPGNKAANWDGVFKVTDYIQHVIPLHLSTWHKFSGEERNLPTPHPKQAFEGSCLMCSFGRMTAGTCC